MPARSSRPGACANCSIPRATPTPRPCSARCRSSAARGRSWHSPASRQTSRRCRRAAPSPRAAPRPCPAAPPKSRAKHRSQAPGRPAAGAPRRAPPPPTCQRRPMSPPLLEIEGLTKHFPVTTAVFPRKRVALVKAVDGIDFAVDAGETLGIIGDAGCGKTTTSKLILLQESPTAGAIRFDGEDIAELDGPDLMRYRREVQVVFQDPYSSLSPRMRISEIIAEPLQIHTLLTREQQRERVAEVLDLVGVRPEVAKLFPHEFSCGQRQRDALSRVIVSHNRLSVYTAQMSDN